MAEPTNTGAPTTLRLLEPRALTAADRFSAGVLDRAAPLLRSVTSGSLGFADRLFHYWIGRNTERAPMARSRQAPTQAAMSFPTPWYDEPAKPAWPARGITLRAPTSVARSTAAAATSASSPVGNAPIAEPRAIDFVASYVDAPFYAEPTIASGGRAVETTASSPIAERVRAPIGPAAVAPARPSVVARLLGRLDAVDTLLHGPRPAFTPTAAAPIASAPSFAAPRSSPAVVYVDALPESQPAPTTHGLTSALGSGSSTFARPATGAPSTFAPIATVRATTLQSGAPVHAQAEAQAQTQSQARTSLTLDAALPIAVAWPSVHRFLETLAGPIALAQAGVIAPMIPAASDALAPRAAAQLARPERSTTASRLGATFARELVTSTGSSLEADAAPSATTTAARAPIFASERATDRATALGELRQVSMPGPERFQPGRLAQQAELLGRVAESRVARQLGFVPEAPPRSVLWSADAFTFVAPDVPNAMPQEHRAQIAARALSAAPAAAAQSAASPTGAPRSAGGLASGLPLLRTPSGLFLSQVGPVATESAPQSVAGVLSFVDRQIGARLARDTRALAVSPPDVVYVQSPLDEQPVAPNARAAAGSAAARPFVVAGAPLAPVGSASYAEAAGQVTSLTAAMPAGLDARPAADFASTSALGRVGLRSEQLAGEIGVRVGGLASEFLIDPAGNADAAEGYAPIVPQLDASQRPWLSTQEWVLLSMFPSTTTALEIASTAAQRSVAASVAAGEPTTSLARQSGPRPLVLGTEATPTSSAVTGARGALSLPSLSAGLRQVEQLSVGNVPSLETPASDAHAASSRSSEASSQRASGADHPSQIMASLVAPAARPTPPRAQLTQRLPDGRAPRGARLFPTLATPVVASSAFFDGGAPTAVLAGSEAAERRVESPVGAPLWGHLRPLVTTAGGAASSAQSSAAPKAFAEARPAVRPEPTARAVAMELIAPFVEAARSESTTGAASFSRAESPVVSGRAPDDASRSLMTALNAAQSSGGHSGNDRLTLADLTLISFVSATERVAAASEGAAPTPSGAAATDLPPSASASADGAEFDESEVQRLARRVYEKLRLLIRDQNERKGNSWER